MGGSVGKEGFIRDGPTHRRARAIATADRRPRRALRWGGLALAATAGAIFTSAQVVPASAGCRGTRWLGAWRNDPGAAHFLGYTFADQSLRESLTPLFGGRRVRIRLSNQFGSSPAIFDHVYVGRQLHRTGPTIVAGTNKRVTFNGRAKVRLPAGAEAVSDPVRLKVRPLRHLVVSIDVSPRSTAIATVHLIGRQTSYATPPGTNDQAADSAGTAFTLSTDMPFSSARSFVTGVDVRAPRRDGAVVAFGDSITDGFQGEPGSLLENKAGIDDDVRYPDFLARRLIRRNGRLRLSVLNAGITGNRILRDGSFTDPGSYPFFGPSGLKRLKHDAISPAGVRDVIVLEGINDIGMTPNASAAGVIAGLKKIVKRLEAHKLHVLLGTLTPAGGYSAPSYGSAAANAKRVSVNRWVRKQHLSDGVVHFARAIRNPSDPSRLLPAYDSGDHLHPSTAGYRAMAQAVKLSQLKASACAP